MPLCFVEAINKSITVLNCAGNSLQRMRLHLAKRNHTVFFQKFFRQDKFFRLNPLRIFYTYSLRIINCRNPILFQIPVDSGTMNHSGCRTITTGISKRKILISLFSHQSGKHTDHRRMRDDCFVNFCFFEQVGFQQNRLFFLYNLLNSAQKLQTDFKILINNFFPV